MAEPVTIGGQTFIKTTDGWIDKKTKRPADKNLVGLLESVSPGPVQPKQRIKVDKNQPPVSVAGTKYVYDLNREAWVDEKTKLPAGPALQQVITENVNSKSISKILDVAEEEMRQANAPGGIDPEFKKRKESARKAAAEEIAKRFQSISGQVKQARTEGTVAASPQARAVGGKALAVNVTIVKMIGVLASIDSFLNQKLQNQKILARNAALSNREAQIEQKDQQQDQLKQKDAEKAGGAGLGLLAVGALGLLAFDPVRQGLADLATGVVGVAKFVGSVISGINDVFSFLLGGKRRTTTEQTTTEPTPQTTQQATPVTPEQTPTQPNATPATAEQQPSFLGTVTTGAILGATVGSIVPGVGTGTAAVVGAAIGAASYVKQAVSNPTTATPVAASTPTSTNTKQTFAEKMQSNARKNANLPAVEKPNGENYDGLRIKSAESTAGGQAAKNTIEFAKILQAQLPELVRFTAFNDSYHRGKISKHNQGLAFDFTISDPMQAKAVTEKIKAIADANKYKVAIIDEYTNPSAGATGGHIHVSVLGPGVGSTIYDRGGAQDGSLLSGIGQGITASLETAAEFLGKLTGAVIQPGVPKEDIGKIMNSAATHMNAEVVDSKTVKTPVEKPKPVAPNINKTEGGAIQNPPTEVDRNGVYYYLRRFGFQDLNIPSAALPKTAA